MTQSALESFVLGKMQSLRHGITRHDRGVLLGLMLSLVPIFPAPLFGLAIALFNRRFVRQGSISNDETTMIHVSIYIAIINSALAAALLWWVVHLLAGVNPKSIFSHLQFFPLALWAHHHTQSI